MHLKQVAVQANLWDLLVGRTVREIRLSDVTVDLDLATETADKETRRRGDKEQRQTAADKEQRQRPQPRLTPGASGVTVAEGERKGQEDSLNEKQVGDGTRVEKPGGEGRAEAWPLAVNQIVLERCRVNLRDPVSDRVTQVILPLVLVELDRRSGVLSWRFSLRVGEDGVVASEGRFVLPRLAVGPADLRGSLQLTWSNLSLKGLPASLLKRLGLVELGGTVNGSLHAQLSQDWTLAYDATGSTQGLLVQSATGKPVHVSQAAAGVAGQWQMIERRVRVQKAWAQLPGAELKAAEPALVYDGQTNQVVQSNLSAKITDAKVLREAVEQLGVAVPGDLELAGDGGFEVHIAREESATVAWLAMSGEGLGGRFGGYYEHRDGQPLGVNVSCRLWDDGSLELQSATLDLPGGRVRASAHLGAQAEDAGRSLVLKDSRVRVEWDDFEKFAVQVPVLAKLLQPIVQVSGAGGLQVQAAAGAEGVRAGVSVNLPVGSRVVAADWLDKPAGRDLRLDVATRLGSRYDWLAVDEVRVWEGDGNNSHPQISQITQIPNNNGNGGVQGSGFRVQGDNSYNNGSHGFTRTHADSNSNNDNSHDNDSRRLTQIDADKNNSYGNDNKGPTSTTLGTDAAEAGTHTRFVGLSLGNDSMAANDAAMAPDNDNKDTARAEARTLNNGAGVAPEAAVVVDLRELKVTARRVVERGKPVLGLDLQGVLARLDATALRGLSPRLATVLARFGMDGELRGRTSVNCLVDAGGASLRVLGVQAGGELGLDDLALSVEGVVHKRVGEKLRLAGSMAYQWNEERKGRGFGSGSIESQGFVGQAWYENSPGSAGAQQWAWGWMDVRDVQQAAAMLPAVAQRVRQENVDGGVSGRWEWTRHRDTFDLDCDFDLTGIQCQSALLGINKWSGLPARVEMAVSGPAGSAAGANARLWRLPKVAFVLGRSHAGITDAQVEMAEPWAKLLAGQGREAVHSIDFTWPIRQASGKVSGTTVFGEALTSVSQELDTLLRKVQASGPVPWTVDWRYSQGQGTDFVAQADAGRLALRAEGFDKPADVPLAASIKGKAELYQDARNQLMLLLNVAQAQGEAADLTWSGQSQAEFALAAGQWQPKSIKVSGKFNSPQIEQLAEWFEPARAWQVQGHVAAEGSAVFAEQTGWKVEDLDVGMWPMECSVQGMPCRVLGMVNLQDHTAAATGLEVLFGKTTGRVTFDATLEDHALNGQVGVALANLDVEELVGWGGRQQRQTRRQGDKETRSNDNGHDNDSHRLTQMDNGNGHSNDISHRLTQIDADNNHSHDNKDTAPFDFAQDKRAEARALNKGPAEAGTHTRVAASAPGKRSMAADDAAVAPEQPSVVDWGRSNLKFVGAADRVSAPIEVGRPAVTLNALAWRGSLDHGALAVDFAGTFQGGPLSADVQGNLVDTKVPLKVHYRAERTDATDLTRQMVVKGFPGMTVDGPVTLDETLTIDMARETVAIPSVGELIVEGGVVRGAAAPKWVTRLFPGLQLASFKFTRMHNWYERDASGKTVNRIIFRGSPWSMYMNGWSQADGQMRYEIGVDLLGPVESEYWATADRGRLPLFIKTGQVVDGKLQNEVVSFLGPQQIGERILKDNLLTITYHAVRQQVLRGRPDTADNVTK